MLNYMLNNFGHRPKLDIDPRLWNTFGGFILGRVYRTNHPVFDLLIKNFHPLCPLILIELPYT